MAKTITIGETAKIESITGYVIDDQSQPRGKYLAAMVYVLVRRKNPEFTLEDAYAMDVEDAEKVISEYFGDADPNSAAG